MEDINQQKIVTKEIVSEALGGVEVISVNWEPAVAKGEHYLSTLMRVDVKFRRTGKNPVEKTKIIVKTYPDGVLQEFIKDSELLIREITCYKQVIPRLNFILKKDLTPKHLGPIKDDLLILEDLSLKGFKMCDRIEKMDFKHCEASVKILAELHASSIIAYNEDPSIFDEIKKETIYTDKNSFQKRFVVNGFNFLADEFKKIPHLNHYSSKLNLAGERTWLAVLEAMKTRNGDVNVFNHGDFWTTNILFRYDDQNNIEEIKLVDFQFSRWTSPAMDLIMFFNTSVKNREYIPKLTSVYLKHLNGHFKQNIMSPENFEETLQRFQCFGLLLAVCTMPICILDSKNAMNFENIKKEDFEENFSNERPNPYLAACKDEGYQKIIPEFLDFYIKIGLL